MEDRLFDYPSERLIAAGRVLLVVLALLAATLEPPPTRPVEATFLILGAYLLFAVVQAGLAVRRLPSLRQQVFAHFFDIAAVSGLIASTEGSSSPFFVFFIFILVASTIRWNWRGALVTGVLLTAAYILLALLIGSDADELTRSVNRSSFLLVGGSLLGYVGAYRERSRRRLAQLVAWPGPDRNSTASPPIRGALAHAAALLRAPRILVVWEQPEEPFRHVTLFANGEVRHRREPADRFGSLVEPVQAARSFLADVSKETDRSGRPAVPLIDPDLRATFAIKKVLSAPFERDLCRGRIFILDPASSSDDNLLLVELIAGRLGVDLEHYLLRHEARTVTALQERERVARDLHDGLLQSLAAANIRFKLCEGGAPEAIRAQIAATRALLMDEQQRIRRFVEDHRPSPITTRDVALQDAIGPRLRVLGDQWQCEVAFEVLPPDLRVSSALARHVRHLLAEAVSNAARHGPASRVQISVTRSDNVLSITVGDGGGGFRGLCGRYEDEELKALELGPASLRARVAELGGTLSLDTSPAGARIDVRLPL